MTEQNVTVHDFVFKTGSKSLLWELAEGSEYWQKAEKFVQDNQNKLITDLSKVQLSWLRKIREDLVDEASK